MLIHWTQVSVKGYLQPELRWMERGELGVGIVLCMRCACVVHVCVHACAQRAIMGENKQLCASKPPFRETSSWFVASANFHAISTLSRQISRYQQFHKRFYICIYFVFNIFLYLTIVSFKPEWACSSKLLAINQQTVCLQSRGRA